MNHSPNRLVFCSLSAVGLLLVVTGCDTARDDRVPMQVRPDAGGLGDSATTLNPSSTQLFGATPSVSVQASASVTSSLLPAGYVGPTAENPIVTCSEAKATGEAPMLDDFEDGDEYTPAVDGRAGGWYFYDDETGGERTNVITADATGKRAGAMLKVTGANFSDWGSGFGAGMAWDPVECWYNASHYAGLRFWARGEGSVRVAFQNPAVRPVAMGGSCADDARCFDSHGVDFTLSSEWVAYELPFSEFTQAGWGEAVGAFDPSQIYILEFQFGAVKPYEIWLDDVAFFAAGDQSVADGGQGSDQDSAVADSGAADSSITNNEANDGAVRDGEANDGAVRDSEADDSAAVRDSAARDGGTADE